MDNIKSDLGILLSTQISTIDTNANTGSNMIRVLTSGSDTLCADMLRNTLAVIKLLGSLYAFMIPSELSKLLNRVDLFDEGAALLKAEHQVTMTTMTTTTTVVAAAAAATEATKATAVTAMAGGTNNNQL